MEREPHCLPMRRKLDATMPVAEFPPGWRMVDITEEDGHLWEAVMEDAYGETFLPGTFRGVMVAHPYYHEGQVFVLLDETGLPAGTVAAWTDDATWREATQGAVIHVGVVHARRGHGLARQLVYHALHALRVRGYEVSVLGVMEENFSAIKTYLNCGFVPEIDEPMEAEYWQRQFAALGLPRYAGEFRLRDAGELPLPPRPWPYQLEYYARAEWRGENYVYGGWYWHHLFHVTAAHAIRLKPLIQRSAHAEALVSALESGKALNLFVDRPVAPGALLLERGDGVLYLIGECRDARFCAGVQEYIAHRCAPKFARENITVRLVDEDFRGVACAPRIVPGLTYGMPMALAEDAGY